jgi:protein-tyrosine-phosphatase
MAEGWTRKLKEDIIDVYSASVAVFQDGIKMPDSAS